MNTQYTTQTVEYHKCNPFVFTNKINNDNLQTPVPCMMDLNINTIVPDCLFAPQKKPYQ